MKILSEAAKFYEVDKVMGLCRAGPIFDLVVKEGLSEEVTSELTSEG